MHVWTPLYPAVQVDALGLPGAVRFARGRRVVIWG